MHTIWIILIIAALLGAISPMVGAWFLVAVIALAAGAGVREEMRHGPLD